MAPTSSFLFWQSCLSLALPVQSLAGLLTCSSPACWFRDAGCCLPVNPRLKSTSPQTLNPELATPTAAGDRAMLPWNCVCWHWAIEADPEDGRPDQWDHRTPFSQVSAFLPAAEAENWLATHFGVIFARSPRPWERAVDFEVPIWVDSLGLEPPILTEFFWAAPIGLIELGLAEDLAGV